MQLLLFLSALLAGLTGAITGDRYVRVVQQQNGAAISRVAETVAEVAAVRRTAHVARPFAGGPVVAQPAFAVHPAPAPRPARLTSERRLE